MSFSFSCSVQSGLWCQDEFLHYLLLSLLCNLQAAVSVMGSIDIDSVFSRAKVEDNFTRWQVCLWCSWCRPEMLRKHFGHTFLQLGVRCDTNSFTSQRPFQTWLELFFFLAPRC